MASVVPHPGDGGRMNMPRSSGSISVWTNSLMAYVDYRTGLPRVIPDRRGQVLIPSVVSFTPERPLVGDDAKGLLAQEPGSTVFSVKRLLGRNYDDVASELDRARGRGAPGPRPLPVNVPPRSDSVDAAWAIVDPMLDDPPAGLPLRARHLWSGEADASSRATGAGAVRSRQGAPAAMSGGPAERLRISPAPVVRAPAETGPARSWRTAYAVPPRKSRPRPDV